MPALTPQGFADAMFGAFNTYWAGRTEIVWPNKPFDPASIGVAADDAYVKPSIVDTPGSQVPRSGSASPQLLSREGFFGVEIFTRGEESTDRANELADDVLVFLERPPVTIPGVLLSRRGLLPLGFQGAWYQVNATAAFLYFTDRAP